MSIHACCQLYVGRTVWVDLSTFIDQNLDTGRKTMVMVEELHFIYSVGCLMFHMNRGERENFEPIYS